MPLQTLFGNKTDIAIERIKQFVPEEGYWVAFSGGKDSVVLIDLVKRSEVKYTAFYNLTTVDPPELVKFIKKQHPYVKINIPKMSMYELIVHKKMPPTRVVRYCCEWLKEGRGTGHKDRERIVVTGVRWAESARRKNRGMVETCKNFPSKRYLNPIIDWTDEEVWEYIKTYNIPVCELYKEGWKRLGCIMCPMSGKENMEREAKRWPMIAEAYRKAIAKAVEERHKAELSNEPDHWGTAEDMWNWWINGGAKEEDESQGRFFFE